MKDNGYAYPGNELELFAQARNWKSYMAALLKPYISGNVLEVGAGLATNTGYLMCPDVKSWTLLEPDQKMAGRLDEALKKSALPPACQVICADTGQLPRVPAYDCILYIDVLEHILNDKEELETASALLKPGGKLLVLAPAHPYLMSPFDIAIGHYRRYTINALRELTPKDTRKLRFFYADSAGLCASLSNKWMLRQSMPTEKQIRFWDRFLVPASKILDKVLFHGAGKSVIAIWEKNQPAS
ncbi:MAG TPA: methyltransferase type 12 [Chitinophagaceae bacterium]|nr:methyltransferase type 12 [Chitinophagaceae bacterium]HRF26605.1 class I SAM-dependent methyltransferase [Ferruginibacter sp.]